MLLRAIIPLLCAACPVWAEPIKVRVSSGTGFFVHSDGHLLTNHHVVAPCGRDPKGLEIEGGPPLFRATARVIGVDETHDLALLKIEQTASNIAVFRSAEDTLSTGERMVVIGYPLSGKRMVQEGTIEGTTGPQGEPHMIQFSSLIQQGNSGGPLLDSAGRVIGIVTAKAKAMMFDPALAQTRTIHEMDIAITSRTVVDFLEIQRVSPRIAHNGIARTLDHIEKDTQSSIIKVYCQVR